MHQLPFKANCLKGRRGQMIPDSAVRNRHRKAYIEAGIRANAGLGVRVLNRRVARARNRVVTSHGFQ
jgi:hypothetical protein